MDHTRNRLWMCRHFASRGCVSKRIFELDFLVPGRIEDQCSRCRGDESFEDGCTDGTNQGSSRLGTLHRRLCVVTKRKSRFEVWVLNTERYVHQELSKRYSFTGVGIERDYHRLHTICILDDGRIIVGILNPAI